MARWGSGEVGGEEVETLFEELKGRLHLLQIEPIVESEWNDVIDGERDAALNPHPPQPNSGSEGHIPVCSR